MSANAILPKERLTRFDKWALPINVPPRATIALCETSAHVLQALARLNDPAVDMIVALMPEAAAECHLLGRAYLKLEDCFDETILCSLSEPLMTMQAAWADAVDEFLLRAVPEFRPGEFRPARWHFFFLKILSDELLIRSLSLAYLFHAAPEARFIYFTENQPPVLKPDLFFNESVYQLILPMCAQAYGIRIDFEIVSPASAAFKPSARLSQRIKDWLPVSLQAQAREWRDLGRLGYWRNQFRPALAPHLLYKRGFDVSYVARAAARRGWRCDEMSGLYANLLSRLPPAAGVRQALTAAWAQIVGTPLLCEPFRWVGVDLSATVQNRLYSWWHEVIPHMWQVFTSARAHFSRQAPTVCLIASPWEPEDHAVLHAARSSGVPTVTYQHGGFEGNCEYILHDMTDLRYSDYRLVYGAGNEAYLRERLTHYPDRRAQPLVVGSARLEAVQSTGSRRRDTVRNRLSLESDQPLVFYMPTMYMRYHRYLACEDNGDVPYFELQARVVEVMREFPTIQFVYRKFPSGPTDPILRLIAERCPNCRVETRIPTSALLWAADAHILDIPSTGMLEAMLTRKPMLVFADAQHIRLRSAARQLLQKRAVLTETPAAFIDELRRFLNAGQFAEVRDPDREFLRAFGLGPDDGCSAQRTVEAMQTLFVRRASIHSSASIESE